MLIIVFGLLIGFLLGLLGGGGTILAVPVFVYLMGHSMKIAVAMSLAVVGSTTLIASITQFIQKNIRLFVVAIFGSSTIVGAIVGVRIALILSDIAQLVLFGITMLIASYFMLTNKKNYQESDSNISTLSLIFQGICVGCLSSIVGVGGGFIIVPALVIAGKLPIKEAIGTSLVIICINANTSFLLYLQHDVSIPLKETIYFIICSICGTFIGNYYMNKVPQQKLKKIFAIFLLLMACLILAKSLLLN